ncbi:MAG: hypothetical protein JWN95_874 [Frankiales bacterium]|nr:hypothetical protein [Frankiales bacterium]
MALSVPPTVVAARRRLVVGAAVLLLAFVLLAVARLAAGSQHHAYDGSGASPPSTYRLTAGKVYQLSSTDGPATLAAKGVIGSGVTLNCTGTSSDGAQPLSIVATMDDARDLHVFATFQLTRSGDYHVSCQGVPKVFVDDADDAGSAWPSGIVVVTTVLAAIGVALAASGGYAVREADQVDG